jgi:hypothetical protein
MTQDILILLTVVAMSCMATICFIVHQVFATRRMRIEYNGEYTEKEIEQIINDKFKSMIRNQSNNFVYHDTVKITELKDKEEVKKGKK